MFTSIKPAAVAALLLTAVSASAETTLDLSVFKLVAEVVVENGVETQKTSMVPATSSVPGDTMMYRISMHNTDDLDATDIDMVLPLDAHTSFVEGSLSGDIDVSALYSVNNGDFFGAISELTVKKDDELRPATVDDLTNIKILIPILAAGEHAKIEYAITVD